MQKSVVFLYTSKEQFEILKYYNSIKIIKHFEKNLTKIFNTGMTENYKALLRDIREDPNKWGIHE